MLALCRDIGTVTKDSILKKLNTTKMRLQGTNTLQALNINPGKSPETNYEFLTITSKEKPLALKLSMIAGRA